MNKHSYPEDAFHFQRICCHFMTQYPPWKPSQSLRWQKYIRKIATLNFFNVFWIIFELEMDKLVFRTCSSGCDWPRFALEMGLCDPCRSSDSEIFGGLRRKTVSRLVHLEHAFRSLVYPDSPSWTFAVPAVVPKLGSQNVSNKIRLFRPSDPNRRGIAGIYDNANVLQLH